MQIRTLPHRSRRKPTPGKRDRRPRCPLLDGRRVDPHARLDVWRIDDKGRPTEPATTATSQPIRLGLNATMSDLLAAIRHLGEGRYRVIARAGRIVGRQDYETRYPGRPWSASPLFHVPSPVERLRAQLDAERAAHAETASERDAARVQVGQLRSELDALRREVEARDGRPEATQAESRGQRCRARAMGSHPGVSRDRDAALVAALARAIDRWRPDPDEPEP